jgi:hypothetical protein
VVLIDLDCFYAQVEQVRLGIPKEEPLAVRSLEHVLEKLIIGPTVAGILDRWVNSNSRD